MSQEVWCFLHGFPTLHCGSWNFLSQRPDCGLSTCHTEAETNAAGNPAAHECKVCAAERRRRCVVGKDQKDQRFLYQPFVHSLINAAKYIAANLRAKWVAATQNKTLLWVIAQDTPLFQMDTNDPKQVRARRENWLQRHDQATGGVVGLLPLLQGMPIRITQTLPQLKELGLYKNTRGTLWDWSLHPSDRDANNTPPASDIVLQAMPLALYVKIADATWQQHQSLPPGVAKIMPVTQHWPLETNGKATVSRKGFPLACDFSGGPRIHLWVRPCPRARLTSACGTPPRPGKLNLAVTCAYPVSERAKICA